MAALPKNSWTGGPKQGLMARAMLQIQAQADKTVACWSSATWQPLVYKGLELLEVQALAIAHAAVSHALRLEVHLQLPY